MADIKEKNENNKIEAEVAKHSFSGEYIYGRGRRKEASARVRLYKGNDKLVVNGKTGEEYFSNFSVLPKNAVEPLITTGNVGKYDISCVVEGGGKKGQSEAIRLGIARALLKINEEYRKTLRLAGFLTRDPRVKERKKPGLKRARKAPQFSKR